MIDLKIFHMSD